MFKTTATSNPSLTKEPIWGIRIVYLFCSIFILLSRESDGGAMCWTNPHPLRSCPFSSFPVVSLTSYHWIVFDEGGSWTSDHAIVITRLP